MELTNYKKNCKAKEGINRLALLILLIFFTLSTFAQITIGLSEEPIKGALLQLKDKDNIADDKPNASKGLALPRLNLSDKKQLYPMFLVNPDNPASGPNAIYSTNKNALDKAHTGLIVFNLNESHEKDLCLGLNQWDGQQWNCFQQKMGNAIGYITDCSSINFSGQYLHNVSLSSGNYMNITLVVTKTGAYTITARAAYAGDNTLDNGYYFTTTGVFLTTGTYTLQVPGSGTPLKPTPTGNAGDIITITMNNEPLTLNDGVTTCNKTIKVDDSSIKPLYTMDCSETKVRGVYKIDVPLDASTNIIEVKLDVDPAAIGSTYIIETNTIDGIYFKSTGLLTNTTMTVALNGYGTPTTLNDKIFTIKSNSKKSVATCNATVNISYTSKRILGMGYYTTNYGYFINNGASLAVMNKNTNFGTLESSTVKCEGFEFSYLQGSDVPLATSIPNPTKLSQELAKNPDIIVIGYTFNFDSYTIDKLTEYLNKGGVVILFNEYYPTLSRSAVAFFKSLFANENISANNRNHRGVSYRLSSTNDEILNGPFGDARGKLWGEDASSTLAVDNLPLGDLDVYSNATCLNGTTYSGVTMFKHKTLNLFFVGDGGFLSNSSTYIGPTYADKGICPFAIDANYKPIPRTNWGETEATNQSVYNSIIFGNVMAWAIKQAQFNGINTK